MPLLRKQISEAVASAIGGSRLDTLMIDGWLPLLAAVSGKNLKDLWLAWYSGDYPEAFSKALSFYSVADGRINPHSNAWNQGLLQQIFTR